jgi:hypothetical protein
MAKSVMSSVAAFIVIVEPVTIRLPVMVTLAPTARAVELATKTVPTVKALEFTDVAFRVLTLAVAILPSVI